MYWKRTGNEDIIKKGLEEIAEIIVDQFKTEQYHFEKSPCRFTRPDLNVLWNTIYNDGMGHYSMIDDANIPSLLSIPHIGYVDIKDETYQNTRKFLLSAENPFYFEGKYAKGIGSRHTLKNYIWHMALAMQGLTSDSDEEKREIIDMIVNTDAGTGYLHEGFNADNPNEYTREWFT